MNAARMLFLRIRIGLLRVERSLRLDAMLTTYAACPDRLTPETVRDMLSDVDADIARDEAHIAELQAEHHEPGESPVWPIWLLAIVLAVALVALSGCGQYDGPRAEASAVTPSGYRVERLFTIDGCTIYKFVDGGSRYFTNCSGSTGWDERSGKTTQPAGVVGGRAA